MGARANEVLALIERRAEVEEGVFSRGKRTRFDPSAHPRDRLGMFTGEVMTLMRHDRVQLPSGVEVKRERDNRYLVTNKGKRVAAGMFPADVARVALETHDFATGARPRPPDTNIPLGTWSVKRKGKTILRQSLEEDSLRETWSPAARAAALMARRRAHVAGKRDALELDDHTRAVGALRHGGHHDFGNGVAVHMRTSDEGDDHLSIHVDGKKDSEVRLHDSYAASGQIRETARLAHKIARGRGGAGA